MNEKEKRKLEEKDLRKRIRNTHWFTAFTFIICLVVFATINLVIRTPFPPYLHNVLIVLLLIYFGIPWLFAKILTYRAG